MVTINSVTQEIEGLIVIHNKNTKRIYTLVKQTISGTNTQLLFKQVYVYNFTNKEYVEIDKDEYEEYHNTEFKDCIIYVDSLNESLTQSLTSKSFERINPNIKYWIKNQA